MDELIVVKVGGSLFDHPALGPGLRRWLSEQPGGQYLFVPGGGPAANVIREYHCSHQLPETLSHWLAIRMMDVNGEMLRHLLGDSAKICSAFQFCSADAHMPDALAHDWRVTSDAIAARIAEIHKAVRLVVFKSVDLPKSITWPEAATHKLVDAAFGEIISRSNVNVEWINFRRYLNGLC